MVCSCKTWLHSPQSLVFMGTHTWETKNGSGWRSSGKFFNIFSSWKDPRRQCMLFSSSHFLFFFLIFCLLLRLIRRCAATGGWTGGWCRRSRRTRSGRCWRSPAGRAGSARAACEWRTCRSFLLLCRTGRHEEVVQMWRLPQRGRSLETPSYTWRFLTLSRMDAQHNLL